MTISYFPNKDISFDGSNGDITPSDTELNQYDSLFIGTGGDVAVEYESGNKQTFLNIANGTRLRVKAKRVLSTGTTASNILGLKVE